MTTQSWLKPKAGFAAYSESVNILRPCMVPTWQWWLLINWMFSMLALWFCIAAIWVVLSADQGLVTNITGFPLACVWTMAVQRPHPGVRRHVQLSRPAAWAPPTAPPRAPSKAAQAATLPPHVAAALGGARLAEPIPASPAVATEPGDELEADAEERAAVAVLPGTVSASPTSPQPSR
jgi:hypothetical protein